MSIISGMIKNGAKEVTHLIQPEIDIIEKEEAKVEPILKKIDPKKVAAFLQQMSGDAITAEELTTLENEGMQVFGAIASVVTKLVAFAK